ncbi:unnamed protein product [Phytophthora lilii]|uniref:Unnamed protein product n=1 Tax=Phytophthora lilii TaxID=2077276 RepID=A0A9W6TYQ8_9STRA|nr:unnamed protein product [Phytophthora lilii]
MLKQVVLAAALVVQAAFIPTVVGHGNIIVPPRTGDSDHVYYFGGPAGTIDMPEIIGSAAYGDYYQAVDEWFTENGSASLKEYITTYGTNISECGNTLKDGTAEPISSDGCAEHDTLGNSHPGPCEIWCDDTRVFNKTNCVTEFSGQSPAMIPIDVSTCKSSSELVFYWLTLHAQPWQVYINCVALDGATASYTSGSASTTAATTSASTAASSTAEATEARQPRAPLLSLLVLQLWKLIRRIVQSLRSPPPLLLPRPKLMRLMIRMLRYSPLLQQRLLPTSARVAAAISRVTATELLCDVRMRVSKNQQHLKIDKPKNLFWRT